MNQKTVGYLRSAKKFIFEIVVYAVTLPWLPVLCIWLLSLVVMMILNTEPAIRLGETLPGDYSNIFSYFSAWILFSIIIFASLLINFIWFRKNQTHEVISICIVFFLFGSFCMLVWPEIDAFLKLRNIV